MLWVVEYCCSIWEGIVETVGLRAAQLRVNMQTSTVQAQ